ncbi:hypothetical protein LguiA_036567 [Lonicera macranthoides]
MHSSSNLVYNSPNQNLVYKKSEFRKPCGEDRRMHSSHFRLSLNGEPLKGHRFLCVILSKLRSDPNGKGWFAGLSNAMPTPQFSLQRRGSSRAGPEVALIKKIPTEEDMAEEQEQVGDNYSTTDHEYSLKPNQKKRVQRKAVPCEEPDRYSSSSTIKIPIQKPKKYHHLPHTLVIGKLHIYMRPKNVVTATATTTTTAFTSRREIEEQEQGDNYTTTHEYSLKTNKKKRLQRSQREALACEELNCYSSSSSTIIPTQKPEKYHHLPYTLVIGKRRIYMRPKNVVIATATTTAFTSRREIEEKEQGDNYSTNHEYSVQANQKKQLQRKAVACEELSQFSSPSTTKLSTQKPKNVVTATATTTRIASTSRKQIMWENYSIMPFKKRRLFLE